MVDGWPLRGQTLAFEGCMASESSSAQMDDRIALLCLQCSSSCWIILYVTVNLFSDGYGMIGPVNKAAGVGDGRECPGVVDVAGQ